MKYLIAILLSFIILFTSCILNQESNYFNVKYYGFDFSYGGYNKNDNDIYLSNIIPFTNISSDTLLYFYPIDSTVSIKDYGYEPFNLIDRVEYNTKWDTIPSRVIIDHLYLIKCRDGFVKLKVTSISGSNIYDMNVIGYYEFSTDSSF